MLADSQEILSLVSPPDCLSTHKGDKMKNTYIKINLDALPAEICYELVMDMMENKNVDGNVSFDSREMIIYLNTENSVVTYQMLLNFQEKHQEFVSCISFEGVE